MQIKTGVEQSVYALLMLNLLPADAVLPADVISDRLGASPSYFQKLLRKLAKANLITSVSGVKGGFKLKKSPEDITVYDVYLAIEGSKNIFTSDGIIHEVLELEKQEQSCLLSSMMTEAETALQQVFERETIASIAQKLEALHYIEEYSALKNSIFTKMVK